MVDKSNERISGLQTLIARFDDLAASRGDRPKLYLIGAGTLLLEGLIVRTTQDLDFICDQEGERFENQVLPTGLHSHRVPSGLVSMPAGWRERSREASEFATRYVRVFVPDIHDRVIDKLARGLATDWQDITAVLESPPDNFAGKILTDRATLLLRRPTSTVFDERRFREQFERLRTVAARHQIQLPDLAV